MALHLIKNLDTKTTLGIWKKEEDLADLLEQVHIHNQENEHFKKFKNDVRKKEWLTTRLLLNTLTKTNPLIQYEETGKPFLTNSKYNISLSHSRNFVCILLSENKPPGIDIEHIAERVLKVKHKFLSNKELEWCNTLEQHTLCWSAKEAIFKTIGEGIDFKDILIHAFNSNKKNGSFNATILNNKNNKSYSVQYSIIENDALTYTFLEKE